MVKDKTTKQQNKKARKQESNPSLLKLRRTGKKEKHISIGGMAFADGIMMRTSDKMAIAVSDRAGKIDLYDFKFKKGIKNTDWLSWPFLRGIRFLIENIYFFTKISWHKRPLIKKIQKRKPKFERFWNRINHYFIYLLYFMFFVAFFDYLYLRINGSMILSGWGIIYDFGFTLLYLFLFLFLFIFVVLNRHDRADIFQYHAAEHKIINAYEIKGSFDKEKIKRQPLINIRCSLPIYFWSIFILSFLIVFLKVNEANWFLGFLVSLGLIFLSFSLSYELVLLSYHKSFKFLYKIIILPFAYIQKMFLIEPDEEHLEVGLVALKEVLKSK